LNFCLHQNKLFVIENLVIPQHPDHRGIIHRVEIGNWMEKLQSSFFRFFSNGRFEAIVTAHSSSKHHGINAIFLLRHKEFSFEYFHDCHFKFVRDFSLIVFSEIINLSC